MTAETSIPPMPAVDESNSDKASVAFSKYRTQLSTHRTGLSERRSEMSGRRTGMSFQRTRMSADRTLMSVIRTSLSMIGFGFTIFQAFRAAQKAGLIGTEGHAAGFFGQALVYLGVGMIAAGVLYHIQFMQGLRQERAAMVRDGYIHGESRFPVSLTFVMALLLLLLGVAAIAGIAFRIGPFS